MKNLDLNKLAEKASDYFDYTCLEDCENVKEEIETLTLEYLSEICSEIVPLSLYMEKYTEAHTLGNPPEFIEDDDYAYGFNYSFDPAMLEGFKKESQEYQEKASKCIFAIFKLLLVCCYKLDINVIDMFENMEKLLNKALKKFKEDP